MDRPLLYGMIMASCSSPEVSNPKKFTAFSKYLSQGGTPHRSGYGFLECRLLNAYMHSDDVKVIRGMAISRFLRPDSYGWAFTDTGKYTVKSGCKIESLYPDKEPEEVTFGPNVNPLLSYTWKLKCPPKLKHFIWQVIKGTIPVAKNLGQELLIVISVVVFVGSRKNPLIMSFLNLHQLYKLGFCQRYLLLWVFFLLLRCLLI